MVREFRHTSGCLCRSSAAGYRNYNTAAFTNVTTNGYWWSALQAASSATNASILNFNSSNVNPANNANRGNAFSVRCVAEF